MAMRGSFRRRDKQNLEVVALDGITLEVRPGEIFGLLGPNGAGKSTTVGVLTTWVRPTPGEAWIGPRRVWKERVRVKRLIGVLPQRPNLDFSLTGHEILMFQPSKPGNGHQVVRFQEQAPPELNPQHKRKGVPC